MNYKLDDNEVILYTANAWYGKKMEMTEFTLTSKKMIFEKNKGIFKKSKELVDLILLSDIKKYNDEVQVKQKSDSLEIQTINKNIQFSLSGKLEANKVYNKLLDVLTGTTYIERGSNKVKDTLDLVDNTLGIDTRGMLKGFTENGIKGTIINGIKKKK